MNSIYTTLTKMFPAGADLHTPSLGASEKIRITECLDSTFVSSVGPMTVAVEKELCARTGSPFAVVTSNGTSALHLCLHTLGIGPGDIVIVPTMTFVATANAVLYTGAQCLFVDIEPERLGIDPVKLAQFLRSECILDKEKGLCVYTKTGQPIRALLLVHLFGIPALLDEIGALCKEFNIELIEDAAESLGSLYGEKHTGTFSRLAALSFNGNKIVTAGGGGAVLVNDAAMYTRIKHLSTTAKIPSEFNFFHDEMGFNYRMPNLNAALLLAQLEKFDALFEQKQALHRAYLEAFRMEVGGTIQEAPSGCTSNYWLNNIILHPSRRTEHQPLIAALNQAKIRVRPPWNLLHTLPYLAHSPRMEDLSVATDFTSRIISLPSSSHLL